MNMQSESKKPTYGVVMIDWFQALCAIGAAMALILEHFNIYSHPVIIPYLSKISFLLLCGLVTSSFFERRFKLQKIEEAVIGNNVVAQKMATIGVVQIYRDRQELPKLEEYLGRAKSDVLIVGISLYGMINSYRNLFEQKIANGCLFRFLLPSSFPDEASISHLADPQAIRATIYDLKRTFGEIADLSNTTSTSRKKRKVEVKVFNFVPPMGVIMVDSCKRSGTIRVELYPYAGKIDKRPSFELQASRDKECLYNYFRERYEDLWAKSRTI